MLTLTNDINSRYAEGLESMANSVYNRFVRETYALQTRDCKTDAKLMLLLYAVDNWSNRAGANNSMTELQLMGILDNIYKLRTPNKTSTGKSSVQGIGNSSLAGGGGAIISPSSSFTLMVLDTATIDLSLSGNRLSADAKISQTTGNRLVAAADGLFVAPVTDQKIYFVTGADFEAGQNIYNNAAMAGKDVIVHHRGLGYLLYNPEDPDDPQNEFRILNTGGIEITIPGFDVHEGNNYFFIIVSTYA